ncbi:hypothetical protein D9C73_016454 [Collichthys lucidus]|uniref:Uncharacterized protein n=1 Tax=Collichthys lucidus TaxID=240159 RepID=A0A4U5V723_COLLU|nr:hypothetical protein D9C73_016454 [Collichthys lucidus]
MAFATVWNYCIPLSIITVACLVRTAAGYRVARARCGEVESEKKAEEEKTGERERIDRAQVASLNAYASAFSFA